MPERAPEGPREIVLGPVGREVEEIRGGDDVFQLERDE